MNEKLYHPNNVVDGIERVPVSFDEIWLDDVSGVLIDLDDTLYLYEPCHEAALLAAYELYDLKLPKQDYLTRYRAARTDVTERLGGQGACRSRLFAFQAMCEAARLSQPYFVALELDKIYWSTFLSTMKPDKRAVVFLQRCLDNQLPVCVVTDMTAQVQIEKIRRLGIGNLVAHLVSSEETGAEKPNARMFLEGLRKINVTAAKAIMLGDSFNKDVKGALSAGVRAGLIRLERDDHA
jgi:FMN phosphatase YigB (HAD superfamily)